MIVLMVAMFALGGVGAVAFRIALPRNPGLAAVGFILGLIAGAIVGVIFPRIITPTGHATGCGAVGSLQNECFEKDGRRGGVIRCENDAFAGEWIKLNS